MKRSKTEIAVKCIVILFWIILACAAESTLLTRFQLFGSVPSALPFIVAAAAVFDGPWAGMLCGAAAGFFMDGVCGQSVCLYTVVYLVCGAVIGAISPELFRKGFLPVVGWGSAVYVISEFLRFFLFFYLFGEVGLSAVVTVLLPGLVYSLIVSPIAAAPSLVFNRVFKQDAPLIR